MGQSVLASDVTLLLQHLWAGILYGNDCLYFEPNLTTYVYGFNFIPVEISFVSHVYVYEQNSSKSSPWGYIRPDYHSIWTGKNERYSSCPILLKGQNKCSVILS